MRQAKLIFIFIFIGQFSYGQYMDSTYKVPSKKYIKYLDVRFENGSMLGNGNDLGDQLINSSYYNGFDIRLGFRKSNPDDIYSNVYRHPYLGVGWYSSTFHNKDVGTPNALYFFLTMPFKYEENKKFTFSYTAAFGLSYNFNPYDSINNPTNVFVGSYRNCYVHLGVLGNYKLSEKLALNGTIGFKHFSNGSFKHPNAGLNLLPLTLGVSYKMNDEKIYQHSKVIPDYIKHDVINVTYSAGSKNYKTGGDNYLKSALGVNYLKQISYKYRLGLGVDVFYAAQSNLRNDSDQSNFSKSVSAAVVGSMEWAITKRLYAPIAFAFYLHRNKQNNESTIYYERVGLRYRLTNHLNTGLTIKAHAGAADFFEWTVGYTFHKDPNKY